MTFEILAVVVFLNVLATIELWRRAARRPEKLKKRFLKRVWESEPITPKHKPPPPLKPDAWGVGKQELQFFDDFKNFANVFNDWQVEPYAYPHGTPWRLQELPKSELLKLGGPDGPTYGRSYAVFHNQVRLGEIEITPHYDYSTQQPHVRVHVELDFARLLHFGTIRAFLADIATHTTEYHPNTLKSVEINQEIDRAIAFVLWETQEISRYGLEPGHGQIEVELEGIASHYLFQAQRKATQTKPVTTGN
jgi:hypothetical protein